MNINGDIMSIITAYGPMVAILIMFYFMLWKPQKAERERREALLANLRRGDEVVTIGGVYGEIVGLDTDTVNLQIASKVIIKISRSAVKDNLTSPELMKDYTKHDYDEPEPEEKRP